MQTQQEVVEPSSQRNIDMFAAIEFGFTRTFKNARYWLLFSLLTMLVMALGFAGIVGPELAKISANPDATSMDSSMSWITIISYIIMIPVAIFFSTISVRQSLREMYRTQPDNNNATQQNQGARWNTMTQDIAWGKIILTYLLTSVITGLLGGIVGGIIGLIFIPVMNGTASIGLTILFTIISIVLYALIIAFSIMIGYAVYFATDPETNTTISPVDCVKASFNAVKPHFWGVFGFNIILALLVGVIAIFTFGLGIIIAYPVVMIAQAHMFRQIAGLYAPVK